MDGQPPYGELSTGASADPTSNAQHLTEERTGGGGNMAGQDTKERLGQSKLAFQK